MKTVDHLFHISKSLDSIKIILAEGFKPSYARETFGQYDILVPMVSFSNILLRDVGKDEVLNYGNYGVAFTRQWGIEKNINPVTYSYEKGELDKAIENYFFYSLFPANLGAYKSEFKKWTEVNQKYPGKLGKFSQQITLTNTPQAVMDILDHLSLHYTDDLADVFIHYANDIRQATLPLIKLAKPYKVKNSAGKEFIAYNDREWRKVYEDLDFLVGGDEVKKWNALPKPHFHDSKFRLKFDIVDLKAILVESDDQAKEITLHLEQNFDQAQVASLIQSKSLIIGTKDQLISENF